MTKESNISSFDFRSQPVTKGSTGRPALHLNLAQITTPGVVIDHPEAPLSLRKNVSLILNCDSFHFKLSLWFMINFMNK